MLRRVMVVVPAVSTTSTSVVSDCPAMVRVTPVPATRTYGPCGRTRERVWPAIGKDWLIARRGGVELDRERAGEGHLRDAQGEGPGDPAGDRRGRARRGEQDERGAVGEGDHSPAEAELDAGGGDAQHLLRGVRGSVRGERGDLLDRDVRAERLAQHREREAGALEAQVRPGGDVEGPASWCPR